LLFFRQKKATVISTPLAVKKNTAATDTQQHKEQQPQQPKTKTTATTAPSTAAQQQ